LARGHQTAAERSRRKARITRAALAEFSKRGYHFTEVETIAKRAGVAKGTVYNYFASKEDILLGVIQAGFEVLGDKMKAIVERCDDPVEIIKATAYEYLRFLDTNKAFHKVLMKEAVQILPKSKDQYHLFLKSHVDQVERLIQKGISSGAFKRVDPYLAALSLIELVAAVMRGTLILGREIDVDRDHKTIMKLYFGGLLKE
jgi:AcrR family transcriptional regulator